MSPKIVHCSTTKIVQIEFGTEINVNMKFWLPSSSYFRQLYIILAIMFLRQNKKCSTFVLCFQTIEFNFIKAFL